MDKLLFGLNVTLIGMIIVFFGLVILIVFINLLKPRGGKKKADVPQAAPRVIAEPVEVIAAEEPQNDDALIAVITAAIAAMLGGQEGAEGNGFVVRHVRRISNGSAWQKAGREEQTYSRL